MTKPNNPNEKYYTIPIKHPIPRPLFPQPIEIIVEKNYKK